MKRSLATLVVPVYNGVSTLRAMFEGLEIQKSKDLISKIIFINDCSVDGSSAELKQYKTISSYDVQIVTHKKNLGLAATYNEGLRVAQTRLVIVMHQDIYLSDKRSIEKIIAPHLADTNTSISYPSFVYPYDVWIKDGFWQKVLFSRLVGKANDKLSGKFDCINRSKNEYFNNTVYRTAGEDFDYEIRMRLKGPVTNVALNVDHLQSSDGSFGLKKMIRKESQLAECYGVNLRKYAQYTPIKDIALLLLRPLILLGILIPVQPIRLAFTGLLLFFVFIYSKSVYLTSYRDPKILLLPFVNFFNMINYTFFLVRGFARAKQTL